MKSGMKRLLSYLLLALLWLLHWLPLPLLRGLGWALGRLLYAVGRERRRVALTNLRLCFPALSETAREGLARDRKSTRLNSSHIQKSRMPSSA